MGAPETINTMRAMRVHQGTGITTDLAITEIMINLKVHRFTHNHFAPLRDDGPRNTHRDPYSYMNGEDDEFNRSPYNYNQNYLGSS